MMLRGGDLNLDRFAQDFDESAMESLKQAMLQQELIFRNQVRELHRLYWIQKNLMNQLHGKNSFLESSRSREVGARNFGALEEAEGSSTYLLLNNHQRGFSNQLPAEMFKGTVESPAKYYLEIESSKEDGIIETTGRGKVGCVTEEEANTAYLGGLENPIKKGIGV